MSPPKGQAHVGGRTSGPWQARRLLQNGTFPGISSVYGKIFATPCWRTRPPLTRRAPITVICSLFYPSSSWAAPRGPKHAKSDSLD